MNNTVCKKVYSYDIFVPFLHLIKKKPFVYHYLRTEVRGDFNIHGTKYFQYAVFLQKSKIHDVVSLLNLWWAKKNLFST